MQNRYQSRTEEESFSFHSRPFTLQNTLPNKTIFLLPSPIKYRRTVRKYSDPETDDPPAPSILLFFPMKSNLFVLLLLIHVFAILSSAQDFDFFYFVQQWPGSFCDTQNGCCYPKTGKPDQDFGIHGLWPNYDDGSYPSNCDPNNPFDPSEVADLTNEMQMEWPSLSCPSSNGNTFWGHEWDKHGTCSESVFDQHGYFQTALRLKKRVNLLQVLADQGIHPDGNLYGLNEIRDAIKAATGYEPGIECNSDESGNSQLYQIFLCVSSSGSSFIRCPTLPRGKCSSQIRFPSF